MTVAETPYNLSLLTQEGGLVFQLKAVNFMGNNLIFLFFLMAIFVGALFALNKRGWTMWSSVAVASFICFAPAFVGRLLEYQGTPMISSGTVIFFGILAAASVLALKFEGKG